MYHIVFNGDENYIKFIAAAINSIVINTNPNESYKNKFTEPLVSDETLFEEKYFFHILTDQLSEETKNKVKMLEEKLNAVFPTSIQLHIIDNSRFYNSTSWRNSTAPNYRLIMTDYIPDNVLKFCYLDGDILVFADLRELFLTQLNDTICSAVIKSSYSDMKKNKKHFILINKNTKISLLDNKSYFNSGVLLINHPQWKTQNIQDGLLTIINNFSLRYPDQDALNAVMKGNITPLDDYWNFTDENAKTEYNNNKIKLRHYIIKPWEYPEIFITALQIRHFDLFDVWWEYAEKTPVFSQELLATKNSEKYQKQVQKTKKKYNKYKKYAFFYNILHFLKYKLFKCLFSTRTNCKN